MRRRLLPLALCATLFLLITEAMAEPMAYSFPYAGVKLTAQAGWLVIAPETLDAQAKALAARGIDAATLANDFAINQTVFAVYLLDGACISLSALKTEQALAWGSVSAMQAAEKDAFIKAYQGAPYQNTVWSEAAPGFLRCDYEMLSGGETRSFARHITIQNGVLYTVTAEGSLPREALYAAGETVLEALLFFPPQETEEEGGETLPDPVMDDGEKTPIALVDFTGMTDADLTPITIQTLPGAELVLKTATDTLRGRAGADGLHTFNLSTRRNTVYAYTLTAAAEGREASVMDIAVSRVLTGEALASAYRSSARFLDSALYAEVSEAPGQYAGMVLQIRGKMAAFVDQDGLPYALVHTINPSTGVWRNPVWVRLYNAGPLVLEEVYTLYGDLTGETAPYTDAAGETYEAPVLLLTILVR